MPRDADDARICQSVRKLSKLAQVAGDRFIPSIARSSNVRTPARRPVLLELERAGCDPNHRLRLAENLNQTERGFNAREITKRLHYYPQRKPVRC